MKIENWKGMKKWEDRRDFRVCLLTVFFPIFYFLTQKSFLVTKNKLKTKIVLNSQNTKEIENMRLPAFNFKLFKNTEKTT